MRNGMLCLGAPAVEAGVQEGREFMIRTTTALALAAVVAFGCSSSQTPPAATAPPSPPVAQATPPTSGAEATATPATPAAPEQELQRVSIDELAALIAHPETVAIIDNNSRERYEQGHVPGARWVGHDQVTADVLPQDRSKRLVFYCANEH